MNAVKVSIIIPVYNTAAYLEKCIGSLVKQTFRDIEIICVNDGSTDESEKVLNAMALQDSRIIVINRETGSGSAAVPRNTGLEMARGKYVIFLDSDDYFSTELIEKLYFHAEKNNADLVMCDNYLISPETGNVEDGETELHRKYLPKQTVFSYRDVSDTIFQISNAACWHKLILKELLDEYSLRFQEGTPSLDDIYFVNSLLIIAKRISILDEKLVYYRVNRPGAQTTRIGIHRYSIYKAFKALNDNLIQLGTYEAVKRSLQSWTVLTMAWWLYSITDYEMFMDLYTLYRTTYFGELGLFDLDPESLYGGTAGFYKSIIEGTLQLPAAVMLDSIIPAKSRVGIYGAGRHGKRIYNAVENGGKHKVAIWCDQNARNMDNPLVVEPAALKNEDIDVLIIAIKDAKIVKEVKRMLINRGISESKILDA